MSRLNSLPSTTNFGGWAWMIEPSLRHSLQIQIGTSIQQVKTAVATYIACILLPHFAAPAFSSFCQSGCCFLYS